MWTAWLSDGRCVHEQDYHGRQLSPWQSLRNECRENKLSLEMIKLELGGVCIYSLNAADGYVFCHEVRSALFSGEARDFVGIGSVVGDVVLMIWTDGTRNTWQDIRSLKDMDVHAILRSS